MTISIVIPVYNGTDTIGRCLDCIYSRDFLPPSNNNKPFTDSYESDSPQYSYLKEKR